MQPPMKDSRKRKRHQQNDETPAHARQISGDMAKGRESIKDDRPRSRRWPATRDFKSEPLPYFKSSSGSRDSPKPPNSCKLPKKSATPRNASALTSVSTNNMPALESLNTVLELFHRLFSDRFSDLDDDFDPDIYIPLEDEEVEVLQENLANYWSFEQNLPNTVLNQMMDHSKEYVQDKIFPYINNSISHGLNFRRTFVRIIRVLWGIRNDVSNILSHFPDTNGWGELISDNCINTVYSQYRIEFVDVVLDRLHEIRQLQNIDSHPPPHYIFEIAKYFTDFTDGQWKTPYIANVFADTTSFLESFDLQNDNINSFLDLATSRAGKENVFASSFSFDRSTRQEAMKRVYTAFSEKFDEFALENPQLSLANQLRQCTHPNAGDNQPISDRFSKLLSIYGGGDLWDTKKEELKDEIIERGNVLASVYQVPSNNWDMESLGEAIRSLADHEKAVSNALRMPNGLPGMTTMLKDTFKAVFRNMFPRTTGRKLPEEFLAEYLEYVILNIEAGTQWQKRNIGYMKTLVMYIRRKDLFISHLRARTRAHDVRHIERRNRLFLNALQEFNRVILVPQDLIDSVRQACRPRLSAQEAVARRAKIVSTKTTELLQTLQGVPLSDLTNIERDALLLYTVSIDRFCGQRQSVYIRMTKLQLDVFNLMLQYEKCPMDVVRQLISQSDTTLTAEEVGSTLNLVITSLKSANLLEVVEYEGRELVCLGNPSLRNPYMEVDPVDPQTAPTPTDVEYLIDNTLISILQADPPHSAHYLNLFAVLFFQMSAIPISAVMLHRSLGSLANRNFIMVEESIATLVPF